jgi:hypothetical protein
MPRATALAKDAARTISGRHAAVARQASKPSASPAAASTASPRSSRERLAPVDLRGPGKLNLNENSLPVRPRAAGAGLSYRDPPPQWQNRGPPTDSGLKANSLPPAEAIAAARALALDQASWPSLPKTPLSLRPVSTGLDPETVPPLAHGLDVVLRESGVHPMLPIRESRRVSKVVHSGRGCVLKSKTALEKIAQPDEIDWLSIPPYTRASDDSALRDVARSQEGVRYTGSTSSMTTALSLLYHAVSNFSDTLLLGGLTKSMSALPVSYTKYHNKPTALAVRPYPDEDAGRRMFSVDMHAGRDTSPSILRDLGHSMERMLTMSAEEFKRRMRLDESEKANAPKPVGNEGYMDAAAAAARQREHEPQFYHYSRADQFLLRAQIDCRDPVTGNVFDLKTRAVAAIRYRIDEYESNTHMKLSYLTGDWGSYEREFYDMVRSVFLKYALQLRIGRMSGAFVTYHNTSQVLGFEFLTLEEMEAYVFGCREWSEIAFSTIIRVLGLVLDEVTSTMQVDHPSYVKIVMVPQASSRSVQIYAQRVHDPTADPLGPDNMSFGPPRLSRGKQKRRRVRAQSTRLDEETDSDESAEQLQTRPGLAHVGSLADSPLSMTLSGVLPAPNLKEMSVTLKGKGGKDTSIYDNIRTQFADSLQSKFGDGDIQAWDLRLAAVVNGAVQRNPFAVLPGDSFQLKYSLRKSRHDGRRVLRDLVKVLDDMYNT